jgi:sugar phosphate isomerase/epimerase
MLRECGVRASSLCRGGFFPASTAVERAERIADNRRALDEAAEVGAPVLVLVSGPAPDRDIDAAREMVFDGILALVDDAARLGVKLAIEPLHPMFAGDRSVVVTLGHANDLAARLASPWVGVAVDVYHVWWDPAVYAEIARRRTIVGFHVGDWLAPPPGPPARPRDDGRWRDRTAAPALGVSAAGYSGPIEVEIFNQAIWDTPGDAVLSTMRERYLAHC